MARARASRAATASRSSGGLKLSSKNTGLKRGVVSAPSFGPGFNVRTARRFCQLILGKEFNPEMIAACHGASVFAPNDDFFFVNPSLFPNNEFDKVSIVSGLINVYSTLPSGTVSNLGSGNIVKYAIGEALPTPLDAWDTNEMFPTFSEPTIVDTALSAGFCRTWTVIPTTLRLLASPW